MNITPVMAAALVWLALPAAAQLPGGGALESLPGAIHENIESRIENRIERNRERAQSRAEQALERQREGLASELENVPRAVLAGQLPDLLPTLPIINAIGQTVLTEVQLANGWRAVEREWLLVVDQNEISALQHPGIEYLEETRLQQLGLVVVRLRVSAELDTSKALRKLLGTATVAQLDRNHIYYPQASAATQPTNNKPELAKRNKPEAAVNAFTKNVAAQNRSTQNKSRPSTAQPICSESLRLGIIDTAVSDKHPAFTGADIEHQAFIPAGLVQPQSHGTAVAGVLVGANDSLVPLLGNAKLLVASAFYSRDASAPGATLMNLVNALGWLAGQRVQVINMSLAGPHNDILQRVIASLAAKDIAIVAAVGNQGPASPPLYPAAYPGVIGVTAVDAKQRIYRWANRGEQVDFAAPGVKVATVRSTGGIGHHTGTSIAAPVVSAHLACALQSTKQSVDFVLSQLRDRAVDLGEQGRDNTFGDGLLAR